MALYTFATRIGTATATAQMPMLHYSMDGRLLDSVSTNVAWLSSDIPDIGQWGRLLPDGRLLVTRNDKIGFIVVDRLRTTTIAKRGTRGGFVEPTREASRGAAPMVLMAEVPSDPVPYLPEEREELQIARDLALDKCQNTRRQRMTVPAVKLPSRGATTDVEGRIWIAKSVTSQKIAARLSWVCNGPAGRFESHVSYEEPPVFAAFQSNGTFLGEIRFPLRARVTFVGNYAWALVPDEDDVLALVKYRLF